MLVEHGTNRIVLLVGTFDRSPEPEINLLCGLLRQHVDVVVGEQAALQMLSDSFRERRRVTTTVQLDGVDSLTTARGFVSLTQPVRVGAGDVDITLTPLPVRQWVIGDSSPANWIARLAIGELVIAVGSTVDILVEHVPVNATLAIAPRGDVSRLWRTIPGITIATNAPGSFSDLTRNLPAGTARLVRTFRRDIAAFIVRDGQLHLPDWTQESASG